MTGKRILQGRTFAWVALLGAPSPRTLRGPWTFVSDGAGCMYPRVEHPDGRVIPWSSIAVAGQE